MNNKIRLKMNNKLLYHHFKKIIIIFNKINLTKFESLLLKIFLVRMKKNLKIQKDKQKKQKKLKKIILTK